MKFKNSQHNSLYNDAISAIKAQKWADAIAQLQTLVLFLQESRDKNTAAQINTLIARLNNPVKRMVVLAEVEAHEAHAAEKALCAEIDALKPVHYISIIGALGLVAILYFGANTTPPAKKAEGGAPQGMAAGMSFFSSPGGLPQASQTRSFTWGVSVSNQRSYSSLV